MDISLLWDDRPWGIDLFSHENLGGEGWPRFHVIGTWSSWQKNLFSTISYLPKLYMAYCTCDGTCWFPHSYAASFSRKLILSETNNIFYSQRNCIWHKLNSIFWKYIKNKGEVTLDSFRNFARVNSYLRLKSFAWKRYWPISLKWNMLRYSVRPFLNALTELYIFY